jgi:uncharacterized protein YbjT (DUF2867 family)
MLNQHTLLYASRLVAVLGCTGTSGSEVMKLLAHENVAVRGILRRPNRSVPVPPRDQPRVTYVMADHTSVEQLTRAFVGAQAFFLSIGTGPEQVQIESNAIKAAQLAGVRRVVKLSAPVIAAPASVEAANWHRAVEQIVSESGLESCFLRPYAFMQNWLRNIEAIRNLGIIIGSAGSFPRNYVDVRDVAEIAVRQLLREQPLGTSAITVAGPEVITNQEMAKRISQVTGADISYKNLSREEHYQLLISQAQLPEWLARHITELEELAVKVPEHPSATVQTLLGKCPRTMDEFLQEHRVDFMPSEVDAPSNVPRPQRGFLTL